MYCNNGYKNNKSNNAGRSRIAVQQKRRHTRFSMMSIAFLFVFVFICILGVHIFSEPNTVQASDSYETSCQSVLIEEGDTLWELAEEYRGYQTAEACMDEIMNMNHLTGDSQLKAGEYLIVPYYIEPSALQ